MSPAGADDDPGALTSHPGRSIEDSIREHVGATCAAVRALLQQCSVASFSVDLDFGIRFVSPALAAITGLPAGDHQDRNIAELIPAGGPLIDVLEQVRATGEPVLDREVVIRGATRVILCCDLLRRDGQVVGLGVEIDDVLRHREVLAIIMRTPVPVAVSRGPAHVLRIANGAWRNMTDYHDPVGTAALHDVFPGPADGSLRAEIDYAFRSGADFEVNTHPFEPRGGAIGTHFCGVALLPIHDPHLSTVSGLVAMAADPVRWFGIASDIERGRREWDQPAELLAYAQAARCEAESANRQKDQFLAALSHELRAPLGALLLWAKVLRDDPSDPELRRRALAAIEECTLAQSRLVDDLLDVSRAITGKLFLDLRLIAIDSVLWAALEGARPAAVGKGIALDARLEPGLGQVRADVGRLRQVLQNLLANAIKFTDAGGRVSLLARQADESIEIEVRDTGLGIPPELLPRLFDAFKQGEESPLTRAHGGLGLGLTIARQLVALHGGSLRAQSEGLGCGAAFTVSLPVADEGSVYRMTPLGSPLLQRLNGLRVLLVDDDPRALEPLALLLEQEGAEVQSAGSAAEAWSAVDRSAPHVIVSDIAMPGEDGDGYSLLRRLRGQAPAVAQGIPAVALTAYARDVDRERAFAAGYDMHLAKPVDVDKLVAAIASLIAGKRPSNGERYRVSNKQSSPPRS